MSFNGLRLEYPLEGSSNYIAWKDRMEAVLDDNGLKEFIDMDIPKPNDATQADAWQKKIAKCRRILLEGVKDHIVSSLHGKATPYLMWKSLTELFQSKSDQRKLALKDKLRTSNARRVTVFPSISRSSLSVEMSWEVWGLLSMMRTWRRSGRVPGTDLRQRELMKRIVLLLPKQRKGRARKLLSLKKKNKQAAGSAGGEALASQFELDFSLIACLVSSVMGSVWFLDSGASFHMTRDRDLFSDVEDKDLGVHIEMGDDGKYSATGIGTISFERESGKPFVLKEVMHVPGLKKNLISVANVRRQGV
eukprot:PITA_28660